MKKTAKTLALLLLLEPLLSLAAYAQRPAPRPWLSRRHTPSPQISEPKRARVSTRRSVRITPQTDFPKAASAPHKGHQIAEQALRYEGVKYRFGGDSKSRGFDCSGLVRRVYNDLNLSRLPHTSGGIYQMGSSVRMNDLRPGDLVFFKNTYRRGISHVGVYAGSNRFVHAQSRRTGVILTSLSEPYYQLHYAGARRLY